MDPHPLLGALDAEGERERQRILGAARVQAQEVLEEGRREAAAVRSSPRALVRSRPAVAPSQAASIEFLHAYARIVDALRQAVLRAIGERGPDQGAELLVRLTLETLERLGPGTYTVDGPPSVVESLESRFRLEGLSVEWRAAESDAVAIGAPDGSLFVEVSFERLVRSYFAAEQGRVARLALGDDAAL